MRRVNVAELAVWSWASADRVEIVRFPPASVGSSGDTEREAK